MIFSCRTRKSPSTDYTYPAWSINTMGERSELVDPGIPSEQPESRPRRESCGMCVEAKLKALGLEVPDLERDYRMSTSGA